MSLDSLLKEAVSKIEISPGFEIITGPMYSGKTNDYINMMNMRKTELRIAMQNMGMESNLRRIRLATGRIVVNFKLASDDRYSRDCVNTHDKISMRATKVIENKDDAPQIVHDFIKTHPYARIFGFSELQFWPREMKNVILELIKKKYVIGEGLNEDYLRNPFETVAELLPYAKIDWRPAKCDYVQDNGHMCMREARHTQRLVDGVPAGILGDAPRIVVGSTKEVGEKKARGRKERLPMITYVPRCIDHHFVPDKDNIQTLVRYYKS